MARTCGYTNFPHGTNMEAQEIFHSTSFGSTVGTKQLTNLCGGYTDYLILPCSVYLSCRNVRNPLYLRIYRGPNSKIITGCIRSFLSLSINFTWFRSPSFCLMERCSNYMMKISETTDMISWPSIVVEQNQQMSIEGFVVSIHQTMSLSIYPPFLSVNA